MENNELYFIDFEFDCNDNLNRILEIGIVNTKLNYKFHEHIFTDDLIAKRVSFLIQKSRDFFNNKNFKKEKEIIEKINYEFKDKKLICFGPNDGTVFKKACQRNGIKKEVSFLDFQKYIQKQNNFGEVISLEKLAILTNMKFNQVHSAFDDAFILEKCYFKYQEMFNKNRQELKNRMSEIQKLPHKMRIDYLDYEGNIVNCKLNENFKIVLIEIKEIKEKQSLDVESEFMQISSDIISELELEEIIKGYRVIIKIYDPIKNLIDENEYFFKSKQDLSNSPQIINVFCENKNELFVINSISFLEGVIKKINYQFNYISGQKFLKNKNFSIKEIKTERENLINLIKKYNV